MAKGSAASEVVAAIVRKTADGGKPEGNEQRKLDQVTISKQTKKAFRNRATEASSNVQLTQQKRVNPTMFARGRKQPPQHRHSTKTALRAPRYPNEPPKTENK